MPGLRVCLVSISKDERELPHSTTHGCYNCIEIAIESARPSESRGPLLHETINEEEEANVKTSNNKVKTDEPRQKELFQCVSKCVSVWQEGERGRKFGARASLPRKGSVRIVGLTLYGSVHVFFFISNSIFELSLRLLRIRADFSLRVAK